VSQAALIQTVLLMALVLAATLEGLAASGHFPQKLRIPAPSHALEAIILWGSLLLTIACLATGIAAALRLIPWYAAVIGSGLSLLAAPPVLRLFPDRFVDGRGALLTLAGICAAIALVLIRLAAS
jgi:hypothetical protein